MDGIDRQSRFIRHQTLLVIDGAVGVHRIPDGKRHPEETLTADAPVAGQAVHPVLIANAHVLRMPLQFTASGQQRVPERHRLDEPLPAGDDLERTIALLVELHRVGDRTWVAKQIAGLAQQLDDARACLRG